MGSVWQLERWFEQVSESERTWEPRKERTSFCFHSVNKEQMGSVVTLAIMIFRYTVLQVYDHSSVLPHRIVAYVSRQHNKNPTVVKGLWSICAIFRVL